MKRPRGYLQPPTEDEPGPAEGIEQQRLWPDNLPGCLKARQISLCGQRDLVEGLFISYRHIDKL